MSRQPFNQSTSWNEPGFVETFRVHPSPKPMLTDEDIIRAVRSIRYASKAARNGRRALAVRALAQAAGISRDTVYVVAATGRMAPETAHKLRMALISDRDRSDMSDPRQS